MNAYVGRLRNVQRPAQFLRKSIFSDTFGTVKKKSKKQLVKHREPNKINVFKYKSKREGVAPIIAGPQTQSIIEISPYIF